MIRLLLVLAGVTFASPSFAQCLRPAFDGLWIALPGANNGMASLDVKWYCTDVHAVPVDGPYTRPPTPPDTMAVTETCQDASCDWGTVDATYVFDAQQWEATFEFGPHERRLVIGKLTAHSHLELDVSVYHYFLDGRPAFWTHHTLMREDASCLLKCGTTLPECSCDPSCATALLGTAACCPDVDFHCVP